MRLTLLCDNFTYIDRYYLGEPAFSCLIEDGARTILFDAGYSDVFMENARRMDIDLSRVTDVALSHGHNDHTGGLPAFFAAFSQPVRLYAHPHAFLPKRDGGLSVGSPLRIDALPPQVEKHIGKAPQWISEHVCFLGEIPRRYEFESQRSVGETRSGGVWTPDALADDTALALTVEDGTFLVAGCAHSGVCNIAAYTKALLGAPLSGYLGGMHLFEADDAFLAVMDELQRLGLAALYPCHCTSLAVKAALCARFKVREVGVSLQLTLQARTPQG
ncbi:MAG: MBL fold metallo-hydrolase [Clostridia bacterium]|nr:MBL fold metallo-hydrolase [Clostridia bacterium]